ncbi:MAG: DotA/TraY family protein [Pseudomonadota bacterium]
MKLLIFLLTVLLSNVSSGNNKVFDGVIYDPDIFNAEMKPDEMGPFLDVSQHILNIAATNNHNNIQNKSVGVTTKFLTDKPIDGHEFMNLLFGTPKDGGSLSVYLRDSKPVGFLRPFFELLITISGWALFVVILITVLRATVDTNKDYEFLGKSISTPFFFVRIAIASLLLMPTGNGYTVLQTVILYSNGLVISSLDSVYGAVVDNTFKINTIETDGAPKVSKVEYQTLLQSAVCHEVLYEGQSGAAVLVGLSNGSSDEGYQKKAGKNLKIKGGYVFGKVSHWYNIFSSGDTVKGACGAFTFSGALPIVEPSSTSALSVLNVYIGTAINTLLTKDVQAVGNTLMQSDRYTMNVDDPQIVNKFSNAKSLRYIAKKIISDEEYDPVQFVKDFDLSWAAVNRSISYNHKIQFNNIRCKLEGSESGIPGCTGVAGGISDNLQNEIKSDGWLMAGANLFKLMTIQSSLSAINRVTYSTFAFNHDELDSDDADTIRNYMQKFVKRVIPASVDGGSSTTAEVPEFDVWQYLGEPKEYGDVGVDICIGPSLNNECISHAVFNKARSFLYHMSHDPGVVTPLNMFHSYGVTGVDDVWSSYKIATAINMGMKFVGYILIGLDFSISAAAGNTLNDFADRGYTATTTILKVLGGIYLVFAWLFPMIPVIAWVIAIADWALTIFVMIFAAPLFAVFHALPDGQGFSSQFAQRGYPSLLGAIFFPYFMLAGLFIFVVLSYGVFTVFGWVFLKAFEAMYSISTIDLFGSIFLWGILLLTLVMIFNHLALIITNGPDRMLRTLGVNEALTSGGNHQQVATQAQGQADQIQAGAQDLSKPVQAGLQKDYSKETTPPPKNDNGDKGGSQPGNVPQSRSESPSQVSNVDSAQDNRPSTNSNLINKGSAFETGVPQEAPGSGKKVPIDPATKEYSSDAKAPLTQRAGAVIKSGLSGVFGAGVTVRGDSKRDINALNQPYKDADIANQKAGDQKVFDAHIANKDKESQDNMADEMAVENNLDNVSAIQKNKQSSLYAADVGGNVKTNIEGAQVREPVNKSGDNHSGKMGDALGGYRKPQIPDDPDDDD